MFPIPPIGHTEKKEKSRFQITLVDKTDATLHPMEYPRFERFFENETERNAFIAAFEQAVLQSGGRLVHDERGSHPVFSKFQIWNQAGRIAYDLVVYH